MKKFFQKVLGVAKLHKGLTLVLICFSMAHWWLWNHYYISVWGWVRYFYFFSWDHPFFALVGIFYWLLYSSIICLAYSFGKRTFISVAIFFLVCIAITIPFSVARVDLSVKFALLLKSNFHWIYLQNYLTWILWSLGLFIPLLIFFIYFLNKTYRKGLFALKGRRYKIFRTTTLVFTVAVLIWHLLILGNIDTESVPDPLYDNEMGRVARAFEALTFFDFNLFPKTTLSGNFSAYETGKGEKMGIHGVYSFMDTLQYEFLSIHGNPLLPRNKDLENFIKQGILVDLGPVLSCGSHTTASMPNMYSLNGCRVGPFFHSELLPHLTQRIGLANHYVGLEGMSQYFYTVFEEYASEQNRHYITYEQTAKGLQITAKDLASYPKVPSSLTFVYYDAVHPGLKCSFLTGGGLPASACRGYEHFSTGTPEYPFGMAMGVGVIESDLVHFIQITENNPRPIFLLLTADHGLSKKFVHGDMADAEVSPDKTQEAVQRHTNVLIYGNKAYRTLEAKKWANLQKNAKSLSGFLNHRILFPSVLDGLGIHWDEGENILSKYSVFSPKLEAITKIKTLPNDYLHKIKTPENWK